MKEPVVHRAGSIDHTFLHEAEHVFYINAESARKRRSHLEAQLSLLWAPEQIHRAPAFTATSLPDLRACASDSGPEWERFTDAVRERQLGNWSGNDQYSVTHRNSTLAKLATVCSHVRAIVQVHSLPADAPYALILEDDADFALFPTWTTSLADIVRRLPSDWDLVQVGYLDWDKHDFDRSDTLAELVAEGINNRSRKRGGDKRLPLIVNEQRFGAGAYLVSRRGAERILAAVQWDGQGFNFTNMHKHCVTRLTADRCLLGFGPHESKNPEDVFLRPMINTSQLVYPPLVVFSGPFAQSQIQQVVKVHDIKAHLSTCLHVGAGLLGWSVANLDRQQATGITADASVIRSRPFTFLQIIKHAAPHHQTMWVRRKMGSEQGETTFAPNRARSLSLGTIVTAADVRAKEALMAAWSRKLAPGSTCMATGEAMPTAIGLCWGGLVSPSNTTCCPLSCGQCSRESWCSTLPGGSQRCCEDEIKLTGVVCGASDQTACLLPAARQAAGAAAGTGATGTATGTLRLALTAAHTSAAKSIPLHQTDPTRLRILGIGLGSTGTTSIYTRLCQLGFAASHWTSVCHNPLGARMQNANVTSELSRMGGIEKSSRKLKVAGLALNVELLEMMYCAEGNAVPATDKHNCSSDKWETRFYDVLGEFLESGIEAVTDTPFSYFVPELIQAFPGARVLLSDRNATAWAERRIAAHANDISGTGGDVICKNYHEIIRHGGSPFHITHCLEGTRRISDGLRVVIGIPQVRSDEGLLVFGPGGLAEPLDW